MTTIDRVVTAIVVVDTTVGALRSNTDKHIAAAIQITKRKDVAFVVFPEQAIGGYYPEDLALFPDFVSGQWIELQRFARATAGSFTIFAIGLLVTYQDEVYNAVALVHNGKILAVIPKEELPTYSVFRELRCLTNGRPGLIGEIGEKVPFGDIVLETPYGTLTAYVCEDVWIKEFGRRGALINLIVNGSPFRAGVVETRSEMLSTRSADTGSLIVYANMTGGNDALVYDGGGYVFSGGRPFGDVPRWSQGIHYVEADLAPARRVRRENTTLRLRSDEHGSATILRPHMSAVASSTSTPRSNPRKDYFVPGGSSSFPPRIAHFEDLICALKTGLNGYFTKTGAFERVLILNSGGRDSMLTTYLAWEWAMEKYVYLPPKERRATVRDTVIVYTMPSRYNSAETQGLAKAQCDELGLELREWSIEEEFTRFIDDLQKVLKGTGRPITALQLQNEQARIRGKRAWALATSWLALWIHTGNQTEGDNGYCTLGADNQGGYSLLRNMLKSVINELIEYIAARNCINSFTELLGTEASAELADNQSDERELGPFLIIERVSQAFLFEKKSPRQIYFELRADGWSDKALTELRPGYQPDDFKKWIKATITRFFRFRFKTVQAPQGVHVGSFDTDRERSLEIPTVVSLEWLRGPFAELEAAP